MPINGSFKKVIAFTLASTAVAAAAQGAAQPVGARDRAQPLCRTTSEQGYPDAVPPILPPPPCSALEAIMQAEAREARRLSYRLPASARWSDVEMNAYASEGRNGS